MFCPTPTESDTWHQTYHLAPNLSPGTRPVTWLQTCHLSPDLSPGAAPFNHTTMDRSNQPTFRPIDRATTLSRRVSPIAIDARVLATPNDDAAEPNCLPPNRSLDAPVRWRRQRPRRAHQGPRPRHRPRPPSWASYRSRRPGSNTTRASFPETPARCRRSNLRCGPSHTSFPVGRSSRLASLSHQEKQCGFF